MKRSIASFPGHLEPRRPRRAAVPLHRAADPTGSTYLRRARRHLGGQEGAACLRDRYPPRCGTVDAPGPGLLLRACVGGVGGRGEGAVLAPGLGPACALSSLPQREGVPQQARATSQEDRAGTRARRRRRSLGRRPRCSSGGRFGVLQRHLDAWPLAAGRGLRRHAPRRRAYGAAHRRRTTKDRTQSSSSGSATAGGARRSPHHPCAPGTRRRRATRSPTSCARLNGRCCLSTFWIRLVVSRNLQKRRARPSRSSAAPARTVT
jgi:hypothetical protein